MVKRCAAYARAGRGPILIKASKPGQDRDLDLPTIEWLEKDLATRRSGLVVISHDRRLLQNLSQATVWLDRGRTRRIERGFADFEPWRDQILAEEEIKEAATAATPGGPGGRRPGSRPAGRR